MAPPVCKKTTRSPFLEMAVADQVDQPGRTFGRIDRIKQDGLGSGEDVYGFQRVIGGHAVAGADIVGIGDNILTRDHAGAAQLFGGLDGEVVDVFLLLGLRCARTPMPRSGILAFIALRPVISPAWVPAEPVACTIWSTFRPVVDELVQHLEARS